MAGQVTVMTRRSSLVAQSSSLSLLLFVAAILRFAWLSDDAYITFRVVDNATAGLGLLERPSASGVHHPLWFFVPWRASRHWRTLLRPSPCQSPCQSWPWRCWPSGCEPRHENAGLGLLVLTLASFRRYATSGLENALSHLLLAFFVWFRQAVAEVQSMPRPAMLPASWPPSGLNRLDALLLVLPGAGLERSGGGGRAGSQTGGARLLPLVVWTLFALFYYGFPFQILLCESGDWHPGRRPRSTGPPIWSTPTLGSLTLTATATACGHRRGAVNARHGGGKHCPCSSSASAATS
jgi:arabinofuranosyltransferase